MPASATPKPNNGTGLFWLVVIGLGAYLWFGTDLFVGSNKVAVYVLNCSNANNGTCVGAWTRGTRTTFTIFPEQQMVISQTDDSAPARLQHCAVVDKENWNCSGEYFSVGFTNGKYSHESNEYVKYVSKWDWLTSNSKTE